MPLFRQSYYHFQGESFTLSSFKEDDRTCYVAQTKYGSTEKVCKMSASEAKAQVLAQARVKIKRAHKTAKK